MKPVFLLFVFMILGNFCINAETEFSSVSKLTWFKGKVVIETEPGRKLAAWKNAVLKPGYVVYTQSDGFAELVLANTSIIRLKPDTQIEIPKSSQNTRKEINVIKHSFGMIFTKVKTGSDFQVKTPTAIAGVRGTAFDSMVDNAGDTILRGFQGTVSVWKADISGNIEGEPVSLIPGVLLDIKRQYSEIKKEKFDIQKAIKEEWAADFDISTEGYGASVDQQKGVGLKILSSSVENGVATITGSVAGEVASITVYCNDEYVKAITPEGETFTVSFDLRAEENEILVIVKSKSGDIIKESFSLTNKVFIEGSITITEPLSGASVGKNVTVRGVVMGNITALNVYVNGELQKEVAVDSMNFEFDVSFEIAQAIIRIAAKDDESIYAEIDVEQDYTPPAITVITPVGVLYENSFNFKGLSDEMLKKVKVTFMPQTSYEEIVYPDISAMMFSIDSWSPGVKYSASYSTSTTSTSSTSGSSTYNSLDTLAEGLGSVELYFDVEAWDMSDNVSKITHTVTYIPAVNPTKTYHRNGITGRIIDGSTSQGVKGAYVKVLSTDYDAYTDDSGYFTIYDIPAGTYQILIKHDNYIQGFTSATVVDGSSTDTGTTQL